MIIDNQLVFSSAQAVTATAASTNVIDLTGGVSLNIGNATTFGAEMGIGDGEAVPKVAAYVGTAFQSGGGATLNIQFQGSTDNSTWTTYVETGAIAASALTANTRVFAIDWPVRLINAAMPRYVRLNYAVATSTFTTGTLNAAIVLQRADWDAGQYPANYVAGA